MLTCLRGNIDQAVGPILKMCLAKRQQNPEEEVIYGSRHYKLIKSQVVLICLWYNPALTLQLLQTLALPTVNKILKDCHAFTHQFELRRVILGFVALLNYLSRREEPSFDAVVPEIMRTLISVTFKLKKLRQDNQSRMKHELDEDRQHHSQKETSGDTSSEDDAFIDKILQGRQP